MPPNKSYEIWDYFTKLDLKNKIANCNECSKNFSYRTSITNLKTHLKIKHLSLYNSFLAKNGLTRPQLVKVQHINPGSQLLIELPLTTPEQKCVKEIKQESIPSTKSINPATRVKKSLPTSDKKHIDAMLLKLFSKTYQPFSLVDESDFVDFVRALNPNYVLPDRKEISERLIPHLYNKCLKEQVRVLNEEAITICLTTECWTSVKLEAFISITAHFINKEFEFKSIVLKCSEIYGDCTSQSLASILRKTCLEWGILNKINFCITDNCPNIVEAVNSLGWTNYGCMAHKLNLTLQQPLKTIDGVLKKVKKIVTYYRASDEAKKKIMKYQIKAAGSNQPLVLINSVSTRWNSLYLMLERFINLQDAGADLPFITSENAVRQLYKVLKPFNEATNELSASKYVSASKAIAVISGLKYTMEELKKKPSYYDAITNVVDSIENQLNTRFQDLEKQEQLALCTLLDPRYKTSMFIDEVAADTTTSNLVHKVFDLLTEEWLNETPEHVSSNTDEELSLWKKRTLILEQRRVNPNQNLHQLAQHEVESYLQDEFAENSCDPCEWWKSSGQHKYPHLAKLFIVNCNIVATSIPSEVLFSKTGYNLFDRRSRLSARKTEQLVFLNLNLSNCDFKTVIP